MKVRIEIDERKLKELVLRHLQSQLGDLEVDEKKVLIQVKSAQNWKAEWEAANYRALYEDEK
jgi:trehalose-6-phosphatase